MNKRELLDRLNNAFFTVMAKTDSNIRLAREINRDIINGMSPQQAILTRDFTKRARMLAIIAAVMQVIDGNKRGFEEIVLFMTMYAVQRPEAFAKKTIEIVNGRGLSKRAKQANVLVARWADKQGEVITRIEQHIKAVEIRTQSEIFKDITLGQQDKDALMREYNNKSRVERALRTELHEQTEQSKNEVARSNGFTHKQWITQRDRRVRDTAWHNAVENKIVPIEDDFVATGTRASHPGDVRLPIGERINCRCYLEYIRR